MMALGALALAVVAGWVVLRVRRWRRAAVPDVPPG
jgi:hypothetical protein